MKHRHLDTGRWTLAAIDSALEYGDLADWRELFAVARRDRACAGDILRMARARSLDGASALAARLVTELWPPIGAELEALDDPTRTGAPEESSLTPPAPAAHTPTSASSPPPP